jgi:hypothetical protein
MLVLRGTWPPSAVEPLLDFVESALPALTIMLERFVGVGRKHRLEEQISTISANAEVIGRAAEVIGSVATVYPAYNALPDDQISVLHELAGEATRALEEVREPRPDGVASAVAGVHEPPGADGRSSASRPAPTR